MCQTTFLNVWYRFNPQIALYSKPSSEFLILEVKSIV